MFFNKKYEQKKKKNFFEKIQKKFSRLFRYKSKKLFRQFSIKKDTTKRNIKINLKFMTFMSLENNKCCAN